MKRNVERAIILMSGGVDSSTVAAFVKHEGFEAYGLTVNYGQLSQREIQAARIVAEFIDVKFDYIDLSSLRNMYNGVTCLVDKKIPVGENFSKEIIVPFRNGILLSPNLVDTLFI